MGMGFWVVCSCGNPDIVVQFHKEWKAHPNLGYFPQPNSPAFDLQTDIRAKATNTPIFGAGKTDKNRYAKNKKGGSRPQTEQFEEDR